MKTTPEERQKLRLMAEMTREHSGSSRAMLRLLDDIEELEKERSVDPTGAISLLLTRFCRDGYCPAVRMQENCPHGSICERVEASQWQGWLKGADDDLHG